MENVTINITGDVHIHINLDDLDDFFEDDEFDEDFDDDDEYDFDDDDCYEITCEKCGDKIYIDGDMLMADEPISCPNCGEPIEFEFEGCDGDCESCEE